MAANSENSTQSGKGSMSATGSEKRAGGRSAVPLSQADALELLRSALAYCRQSGLTVKAANLTDRAGVIVAVEGLVRVEPDAAGGVRLVVC